MSNPDDKKLRIDLWLGAEDAKLLEKLRLLERKISLSATIRACIRGMAHRAGFFDTENPDS